jgi:nitrogen fixation NifU-like protein
MLKGKTIQEAKEIKDKDIAKALDLPPIKLHCSVLAEDSISKAIENWEEKTAHRKHNQYVGTN